MKHSEEHFSDKTIDEQIEQIARTSDPYPASTSPIPTRQDTTDIQLLHDLSSLAHNDVQVLAEIRERLAQTFEENGEIKQPMKNTPTQPIQLQRHGEKKQPAKQRMVQLFSALVAVLIIGSILAMLIVNNSHLSHTASSAAPQDYYSLIGEHLIRVDAKSGAIRWEYTIKQKNPYDLVAKIPFSIDGDTAYVVDTTTEYAINDTNGTLRWSKNYGSTASKNIPLIVNNIFYVKDDTSNKINAFTLSNGEFLQSYNVHSGTGTSAFTVANNTLYFWQNKTIRAIDLKNQQILWTYTLTEKESTVSVETNIYLNDDTIYLNDGVIYLNVATGEAPAPIKRLILALNAVRGTEIGQTPSYAYIPSFTASNNVVYYSIAQQGQITIHAYNVKTDQEVWQKQYSGGGGTINTVDNTTISVIYFDPGAKSGKVITLDAKDGTLTRQDPIANFGPITEENSYLSGFLHTQIGQGQPVLYFFVKNNTTINIFLFTPTGKVITLAYPN